MSRKRAGENLESILLDEVNSRCPICSKFLLEEKNNRTLKKYDIAHIYPSSPTPEQLEILKDVPKPENIESKENWIALCLDCHNRQDFHTTKKDYENLYNKKQRLANQHKAKSSLSDIQIENEIVKVLQKLNTVDKKQLVNLSYKSVSVDKKIARENSLLLNDIRDKVVKYFIFIQETFNNNEISGQNKFNIIATQVRQSFLKADAQNLPQDVVFNSLVEWLDSKTQNQSRVACEYIIAFFVQICEVFNEITQ
jgi:hypothetical protein